MNTTGLAGIAQHIREIRPPNMATLTIAQNEIHIATALVPRQTHVRLP